MITSPTPAEPVPCLPPWAENVLHRPVSIDVDGEFVVFVLLENELADYDSVNPDALVSAVIERFQRKGLPALYATDTPDQHKPALLISLKSYDASSVGGFGLIVVAQAVMRRLIRLAPGDAEEHAIEDWWSRSSFEFCGVEEHVAETCEYLVSIIAEEFEYATRNGRP